MNVCVGRGMGNSSRSGSISAFPFTATTTSGSTSLSAAVTRAAAMTAGIAQHQVDGDVNRRIDNIGR